MLTDGMFMYYGCASLTKPADTPALAYGEHMYKGCKSLTRAADTPKLLYGDWMYSGCTNLAAPWQPVECLEALLED